MPWVLWTRIDTLQRRAARVIFTDANTRTSEQYSGLLTFPKIIMYHSAVRVLLWTSNLARKYVADK